MNNKVWLGDKVSLNLPDGKVLRNFFVVRGLPDGFIVLSRNAKQRYKVSNKHIDIVKVEKSFVSTVEFPKWLLCKEDSEITVQDEIKFLKFLLEADRATQVKVPALYKHFKNNLYATLFVSKPLNNDDFIDKSLKGSISDSVKFHIATFTEDDMSITIIEENGMYYHSDRKYSEDLVVYVGVTKPTYNKYARPLKMFTSKVDKAKYPKVQQELRFELVG